MVARTSAAGSTARITLIRSVAWTSGRRPQRAVESGTIPRRTATSVSSAEESAGVRYGIGKRTSDRVQYHNSLTCGGRIRRRMLRDGLHGLILPHTRGIVQYRSAAPGTATTHRPTRVNDSASRVWGSRPNLPKRHRPARSGGRVICRQFGVTSVGSTCARN